MRIAFLYNAQDHHVLHSLPIACALSEQFADIEVAVLAGSAAQRDLARRLASVYPRHRLRFEALRAAPASRWIASRRIRKFLALLANRTLLGGFDALVVPERTSLLLKRLGVTRPCYIHSFHGSSGHDRVEDPRLGQFDLLLAPSAQRLDRITAARPGRAAVIGYAKLDLVRRLEKEAKPLFAQPRPTILYNPHHWAHKSSWPVIGRQILDHFAGRDDYNLVFAPHVRLFDPRASHEAAFDAWRAQPNLLLDLGSERSIDMSYTLAADIYLGDVSSQVTEFLVRPRPCIFLNPRRLAWRDDPDFAAWRLGRVVETIAELEEALATVAAWQRDHEAAQRAAAAAAFPELATPAPVLGARAIAAFLRDGALRAGWDESDPSPAAREA